MAWCVLQHLGETGLISAVGGYNALIFESALERLEHLVCISTVVGVVPAIIHLGHLVSVAHLYLVLDVWIFQVCFVLYLFVLFQ